MSDEKNNTSDQAEACFTIPLPGGKVARVPREVLERYVDSEAKAAHITPTPPSRTITITVETGSGEVRIDQAGDEDDVVAHSLSVDPNTGMSEWHTDWEYGECDYTDEAGFPQRIHAWHRHPFGNDYTEIYEG